MGTDICAFVEVRKDDGWQYAGDFEQRTGRIKRLPIDRNYDLFSMIDGTRAWRGDSWPHISKNKGIPSDMSQLIWDWLRTLSPAPTDAIDASGSMLLADILDYPWYTAIEIEQHAHPDEIAHYEATGIILPGVDWLKQGWTYEQIDAYLEAHMGYTFVIPQCSLVRQFCFEIVPKLRALGKPEDVRIVYFYF